MAGHGRPGLKDAPVSHADEGGARTWPTETSCALDYHVMNTYSHVIPDLQREAATKMEAALG